MKALLHSRELAGRFNEDEAVWQHFKDKQELRDSNSLVSEEVLDEIAWREAEQECGKPDA